MKQFLDVLGRPLLVHTLQRFEECDAVDDVVVVVPPGKLEYCRQEIVAKFGLGKVAACIEGGETRQDSVWAGLGATAADIVCVHDGVRPAVSCDLIGDCVRTARVFGAAVAAVPARDTIKRVEADEILETLDRRQLWEAQTPQAFRREILLEGFARAREDAYSGTDESSLVERIGVRVKVVTGDPNNLKVTTAEDLAAVRALIGSTG